MASLISLLVLGLDQLSKTWGALVTEVCRGDLDFARASYRVAHHWKKSCDFRILRLSVTVRMTIYAKDPQTIQFPVVAIGGRSLDPPVWEGRPSKLT
jgi:hypothetical protein